ncbi:MAG: ferrous iron transport protein A [Magnetospirillum sp.]|nr:ferrous iron transport protein A [Magnetospirillum sp.]
MPHTHATVPKSLAEAHKGERLLVAAVPAGPAVERRLCEMGLPRGAEVTVVGRMGANGAVIVSAHGTRLVIGAAMAAGIAVTPSKLA